MTASRRGLAILTAIALALGLVVALDRPRAAGPATSRLFPDLDPDAITTITVERPAGTVHLSRIGDRWMVEGDAGGPAAPDVVTDLLGALELASAARWIPGSSARMEPPRVTVKATAGTVSYVLAIGADAGAGLVHAVAPGTGRAALVEDWVARALDRGVEELRDRAVVHVVRPTGIEFHAAGFDLVASGAPLRANLPSGVFRIAPPLASDLVDALLALRFTALPSSPPATSLGGFRVLGATPDEIEHLGPCPEVGDHILLGGSSGLGCVDAAAWDAVVAAVKAIVAGPDVALDLAPIAATSVASITLRDGATLTAAGGGWKLDTPDGPRDADVPAVRAFLAALATPGTISTVAPPGEHPLVVTYADGATDTLDLHGAALTRRGEPRGVSIPRELLETLTLGWRAFADRTVLADERSRVRAFGVGDTGAAPYRVEMGATLEDWNPRDRATADLDAIDALLDLVDSLTADVLLPDVPPTSRRARVLVVEMAPPPTTGAQPTHHTLELFRPLADGRCHARVDRIAALLAADDCATLLAPLAR